MIQIILSLIISLLFVPASFGISISAGEEAPSFNLKSTEGGSLSLNQQKGTVTVIIFWRTDQERSILALKDANDILKNYKGKGMQVLGIIEDSDDIKLAKKIIAENGMTFPLLIDRDRKVYSDYGIRVFPTSVIVDREGAIAYDIPSHPLTYKTKLRGYIKKVLGEINESELKDVVSPHTAGTDQGSLEAQRQYNLALKFTESGLLDMAVNSVTKSIEARPDMLKAHILHGFLHLELKDTDQALNAFKRALELSPGSNDAKTGLGGALILKGDLDRAIEVLEPATVANPYPQMTYYELGKAYEKKGEKDKSIEMYKKAIEKIIKKQILPSSISRCK